MNKKVCVIFSDYPMGTNKTSEKLRMTLGLTLNDDNEVSLVFLGNSRRALGDLDEKEANMQPVGKHLLMISRMKGKIFVEDGDVWPVSDGLKPTAISRAELKGMLDNANVLLH
jgi:hypothetical protein